VNIAAGDMLKRLASGVRPDAFEPAARPPNSTSAHSLDSMDFASLLRSVDAGQFASGLPVRSAPDSPIDLSHSQLDRLAVAADAAEAAGSRRLLALIDGQAVTIDVPQRSVVAGGTIESFAGAVQTDIDGFVLVPEGRAAELRALFAPPLNPAARSAGGTPGAQLTTGPGAIANQSLVAILASLAAGHPTRPDDSIRAA